MTSESIGWLAYFVSSARYRIGAVMVLLTTTERILDALQTLPETSKVELPSNKLPDTLSGPISHATLIALARVTSTSLNTLLHGTRPYFPLPPPPPQPSRGYLALKKQLLADQEQREYDDLVAKRKPRGGLFDTLNEPSDDISPSLILNILLSIVLCAFAAFHVTRYWSNDGLRVLMSLGTAILVGVAEVVVYSAYLRKKAEARDKEAAKRERKTVIGPVEIEKAEEELMQQGTNSRLVVKHKEEIWGRGVNGGMRRRVREEWEKKEAANKENIL